MGQAAGIVFAAGAIAAANEVVFAPAASADNFTERFNWKIVPATAVLALTLSGIEKAAPGFAVGLAGLTMLAVLVVPVGNAPSPVQNVSHTLGIE